MFFECVLLGAFVLPRHSHIGMLHVVGHSKVLFGCQRSYGCCSMIAADSCQVQYPVIMEKIDNSAEAAGCHGAGLVVESRNLAVFVCVAEC